MVATTYPMKPGALGGKPGWPTPHEKEEEPCLETVAITSQMKRRVAVMVATTYPMEPRALGENLGGLHLETVAIISQMKKEKQ